MANEAAIVSIRQPLFLYGAVKLGHTKHSIFHNCSILFLLSCYEAVFVSFYGGKEIPVEKNTAVSGRVMFASSETNLWREKRLIGSYTPDLEIFSQVPPMLKHSVHISNMASEQLNFHGDSTEKRRR